MNNPAVQPSVTAIIADDEALLRHHLDKSLAEVWPELEIVSKAHKRFGGDAEYSAA